MIMDERILLDKENGWKMNFLSGFEGKFVIAEVTLDVFLTSTPTSMEKKSKGKRQLGAWEGMDYEVTGWADYEK